MKVSISLKFLLFEVSACSAFFIPQKEETTSSRLYYQKKFNGNSLDWNNLYLSVRIVTKHSKLRADQFESINHVLYLKTCFCNLVKLDCLHVISVILKEETPNHLFYERSRTNYL